MSYRNGNTLGQSRHHDGARFRNNYPHASRGPLKLARWVWDYITNWPRAVRFPMADNAPAFLRANRTESTLTWIGHATFLIQLGGLNILTDPHLSPRAAPLQWLGPKRVMPPGLAFEDLPPIDLVVISHDHYDHLDDPTVRRLIGSHQPHFFVPLRLGRWLRKRGAEHVTELDWWQAAGHGESRLTAVPVQHFSGRGPFHNRTLWAGWMLELAGRKVFFAGDTGYSRDFADIGRRFAPVDLALLPIGAYESRHFMKPVHVSPEEAVRIHHDIGARHSVAMHWGTFRLTQEPMNEPVERLQVALEGQGLRSEAFTVMQHGETRVLRFRQNAAPVLDAARDLA
ncbi:MAG: MBL fold metallo-hydrolase [Ectothiorhodospiraceae bacterium]|nr:MBL fold metallo-hydrolase [Ectothiorhodospiraceae bacterium]